jgi:hypothetical protein
LGGWNSKLSGDLSVSFITVEITAYDEYTSIVNVADFSSNVYAETIIQMHAQLTALLCGLFQ